MDLTVDEQRAAAARTVHAVWYEYIEEDGWGTDVTWGILRALHTDRSAADADAVARTPPPDAPPGGWSRVAAPANLHALAVIHFADAEAVRALLAGATSVEIAPHVRYSAGYYAVHLASAPLADDELWCAQAVQVWTVYYEDQFHAGANRECYPVAVCLSADEAADEVARRGPLQPGFDGYLAQGPSPLVSGLDRAPAIGAETVREALRRLAAREPGPVAITPR